jgi:hypothetical protein
MSYFQELDWGQKSKYVTRSYVIGKLPSFDVIIIIGNDQ